MLAGLRPWDSQTLGQKGPCSTRPHPALLHPFTLSSPFPSLGCLLPLVGTSLRIGFVTWEMQSSFEELSRPRPSLCTCLLVSQGMWLF